VAISLLPPKYPVQPISTADHYHHFSTTISLLAADMTKRKRDEAEKSHRLSLAELAGHDDVCSDALVDNVRGIAIIGHTMRTDVVSGILQISDTEEPN
jgi:hypothetical protein